MPGIAKMPSQSAIDDLLARHRSASAPVSIDEVANREFLADFDPDKYRLPVQNVGRVTNVRKIIGRLTLRNKVLLVKRKNVLVGRDTLQNQVDFHVGECVKVARNHFTIHLDEADTWTLFVHSPRGLYVDEVLHQKSIHSYIMPEMRCVIRFPGTQLKMFFESFLNEE